MKKKWGWFPYDAGDYKAAQGWLDAQAERGWALKHIYLGRLARLEEAGRPRHFVDLNVVGDTLDQRNQEYLQLCDDAGWELVQDVRNMFLFRAKPGADPAPIQTDEGIEWERFWKKHVLKSALVSAAVIAGLLFMLGILYLVGTEHGRPTVYSVLPASYSSLCYLAMLALAVVVIIWEAGHTAVYYFRCKRAGRVVAPGRSAVVRSSLSGLYLPMCVLIQILSLLELAGMGTTVDLLTNEMLHSDTAAVEVCRAWPVTTAEDFGLDSSLAWSRSLEGHRSVLMDHLEYQEMVSVGEGASANITCERYDCAGETLARWVIAQRKKETERGAFLWRELPWEEAALPDYDESYVCRGNAYLLLREGDIVALVGCSRGVDLTSAAVRDMLWERLDLN